MNILSLFDGIGCGAQALKNLNIQIDNYYSSEVDKYAKKVCVNNHKEVIDLGDVRNWKSWNIDWSSIDLVLAGSPCQGFSFAGKQMNFEDDRSALFFCFLDILNHAISANENVKFLLENVKMQSWCKDFIDKSVGVKGVKINSSLFTCQNRERYYWSNIFFDVDSIADKGVMLKDVVDGASGVWVWPRGGNKGGVKHYNGKSPCITTSSWQHNFKVVVNGEIRMFTTNEAEVMQGLPSGYTSCVSENQAFRLIGNGWTVPVIEFILSGLKGV